MTPVQRVAPYTELPLSHGPTDGLVGHVNRASNAWQDCSDRQEKCSAAMNEWGKNSEVLVQCLGAAICVLSRQAATQLL